MIDLSTLKTFEDAVDAFEKIDFENDPEADDDANSIAQWLWDNCDDGGENAVHEVRLFSEKEKEIKRLIAEKFTK